MFGYRVPSPNEAMLISGGKQRGGSDVTPFRIVVGHGAFVLPVVRKVSFLTLAMQEAEVIEDCYTQQGLTLGVRAVIAFKVADDPGSISNAARRFQDDQRQMSTLVGRIFSGHLRSIIGSMTVESIIRDQQRLGEAILDASKGEMARIGLNVDSLQISQIDDKGSGYIAALAAPHQADVNRAANVARAAADQASAEAQQESDRNQAEFARQTAVARAEYQAEIDVAQQKAAQAGPLAAAQAQQDVLAEQAKVAAKNAVLREAQLQAEVVKPAQAEAERVRIQAEAAAHATRLSAQAAASEGRIALQQAVIAQLPDIMNSAAAGLQNANLTVLNGTQGVNEAIATLAAQGGAVLQSVLGSLHGIGGAPQLGGAATDGTGPDYGPPPEGDLPQA
ncbi:MAG TPA: SPFH domain-containing protein [Frankiaceae bacterium]